MSAGREGPGPKGPWALGSLPCSSSSSPPQRCPGRSQPSSQVSRLLLFLQLPVLAQGKSPGTPGSGVWCPQGCPHGARRGRRRFLAQAPAATSLVLASPTNPARLWSLARTVPSECTDVPGLTRTHCERDILGLPGLGRCESLCYFPLNHLGEAAARGDLWLSLASFLRGGTSAVAVGAGGKV